MRPEYTLALLERAASRHGIDVSAPPPYLDGLFDEQRAFVEDLAKRKVALCGRRAGKTEGLVAWLLDGCEKKPGETNVYISLSQKHARRILWTTLKRVAARHGLRVSYNEQSLIATMPNGSRIWVSGCPDQGQAEDFRGDRYYRVAVDEAQSFPPWLEYLVTDVLDPALMDLSGELALTGTPGLVPAGFFYDVSEGEHRWSTHHWTCLDNPHVPGAEYLERKRAENRWAEDHPTYVREYLGRWVRDDEAIIYPYDPHRNAYDTLPEADRWFRVLTVDLGFSPDGCGFVVAASRPGFPDLYIEAAWREYKLTPPRLAGRISQVMHDYAEADADIHKVALDEGALGKMIAEGLREGGLPVQAAEKKNKAGAIHTVRGMLLAGTLRLRSRLCRQLIEEWQALPWNEKRTDHDERFVDDCSDSVLYNTRAHRLTYRPEEEPPPPGSAEALLEEQKREKARAFREVRDELARRWKGRRRRR